MTPSRRPTPSIAWSVALSAVLSLCGPGLHAFSAPGASESDRARSVGDEDRGSGSLIRAGESHCVVCEFLQQYQSLPEANSEIGAAGPFHPAVALRSVSSPSHRSTQAFPRAPPREIGVELISAV